MHTVAQTKEKSNWLFFHLTGRGVERWGTINIHTGGVTFGRGPMNMGAIP
jgi:hypothetical protein